MADPQIADPFTGGKPPSSAAPPKPPSEKSTPSYEKALADARGVYATDGSRQQETVASGALLGFGPDISGGMARGTVAAENLIKAIQGQHPEYTSDEAARAAKQAAQEALDKYGKDHPVGSVALDMLGALMTPGVGELNDFLKLRKVPALVRATGIGSALGAASDYGHAKGSNSDRMKAAAEGAATGALTGGALHSAGALGGAGARIIAPAIKSTASHLASHLAPGTEEEAAARLEKQEVAGKKMGAKSVDDLVTKQDPTRRALTGNAAEMSGKDVTAAEALGPKGVARLRRTVQSGGAEELEPRITARQEETGQRIADKFAEVGGYDSDAIKDNFENTTKNMRQKATPLYAAWHAQTNIDSSELQALRKTPAFQSAMKEAEKIIGNERGNAVEEGVAAELPLEMKDPELGVKVHTDRVTGKPVMVPRETAISHARSQGFEHSQAAATEAGPLPTAKGYDYVKRGMDSLLNKYRDKVTGKLDTGDADVRALLKVRGELNDELTNPDQPWGKAAKAAFDAGGDPLQMEEAFRSAKDIMSNGVTDHDFEKRISRFTPAQMDALKMGIADYARDLGRSGTARIGPLLTENAKLKIRRVFGQHGGDAIIRDLETERSLQASGKRLTPTPSVGADTHGENIQRGAMESYHGMEAVKDTFRLRWVEALFHTVRLLASRGQKFLETPEGKAANEEIGRLLSMSPSQLDAELDRASTTPEGRSAIRKALDVVRQSRAVQGAVGTGAARMGGLAGGQAHGVLDKDQKPQNDDKPQLIDGISDPFGGNSDNGPTDAQPAETKTDISEVPKADASREQVAGYLENVLGAPVTVTPGSMVSPDEISAAAKAEGMSPDLSTLFARVVQQESGGRTDRVSPKGAVGAGQVMPTTGAEMGLDVRDPAQNLRASARYFKQQMDRFGDPILALAAYNAGPEAVVKYNGVPPYPETINYISSILDQHGAPTHDWNFRPHGMSAEDAGFRLAHSGMPFDQIEITPNGVRVSFGGRMRGQVVYKGRKPTDDDSSSLMALAAMPDNDAGDPAEGAADVDPALESAQ
jgi:Transglycosylase SLT domain